MVGKVRLLMSYHRWTVEALGCRYCSDQTMLDSHLQLCCSLNFGRKPANGCLQAMKRSSGLVVVEMKKADGSPRHGGIC